LQNMETCIYSNHMLHNNKQHILLAGSNTCTTNPRWQTAAI